MDTVHPRDNAELREALAALLERPGVTPAEIDEQIDALLGYTLRRQVSLEHCLMARDKGSLIGVCLCIDGPGRLSTVFIPTQSRFLEPSAVMVGLLEEVARQAGLRNVQLLQATVVPGRRPESGVYRQAGFERLAEMIYMDSDLPQPLRPPQPIVDVEWVSYDNAVHPLFARVVQGTYERSLDCIGLNRVRHIEDILASHKGAGEYDPRFWLVARVDGEPAGVILLSRVPERWALEVVYMGVLPVWRGRGCGVALLLKALQIARQQALTTLTLSVDATNVPALKLYERFGFRETARREVWLRKL
jgi:ribosomal protein S18 acetylase RimI-like enzyme